jgi:hypothetical protein
MVGGFKLCCKSNIIIWVGNTLRWMFVWVVFEIIIIFAIMKKGKTIIKLVFWVVVILATTKFLSERMVAKKYLEISNVKMQKRFFGNIFDATITNNAWISNYSDVVISIDYYGGAGELVSSNLVELNYHIKHGAMPIVFDAPLHPTMRSYKVRIISAQAE